MSELAEPIAYFDLGAAPMRIGGARLKVRDLPLVSAFYQSVLGLAPLESSGDRALLGTAGRPFFELIGDPGLAPASRRDAGLFHTAFLLPSRAALASWVGHVAGLRVQIDGASNHRVSEAIYLSDPEGNGIEIYADRPVSEWHEADGRLAMTTEPLDFPNLMSVAPASPWRGMPDGSVIGHMHLQVGETGAAERFYEGVLGFDVMARYRGASFFGAGGYHHQLGANIWNSRGASPRKPGVAGLEGFDIVLSDRAALEAIAERAKAAGIEAVPAARGFTLRDPWGTAVTLLSE